MQRKARSGLPRDAGAEPLRPVAEADVVLTAVVQQGWRAPGVTVWGTPEDLAAVPSLLCGPGSRPLARLDGSDQTLWVDIVVADDEEPLDDIGQRVLRATVVAEDRIHVAISDAQRAGIQTS